mmetsp:Transcript_33448/g.99854  ORF Transcript_33448/g.99854 Transcript_33448/m.99854 type:complete len:383 (-) Transcript_33448:81-1229(-)
MIEIRHLNGEIAQVKSDTSKLEEQLEDCKRYKAFLDKLTPTEWFEEQQEAQRQRREDAWAAKEEARRAMCYERAAVDAAEQIDRERAAKVEADRKAAGKRRARKKSDEERAVEAAERDEAVAGRAEQLTQRYMKEGEAAARAAEGPEEEEEEELMYFQEPQQLLDRFTALEESNLFLIQNSQETEEALEELKVKLQVAQAKMVDDAAGLQGQIDSLAGQVAAEEEKRRGLAERSGAGGGTQEQTLHELNQKVAEVYKAIFSESDNSLGTLQMLTNIESRLEELLAAIDTMPQDEVEAAQRQKEKERRERVRKVKQAEAAKAAEERIQRAIRRSQEPVARRTGKPIMFRSYLPQSKPKEAVAEKLETGPEKLETDLDFYLNLP